MAREIPQKLLSFLNTGIKDVDDGYEYASELNRILNSDVCQTNLNPKEIEILRDYADKVRKIGEFSYYSEEKVKDIEREHFGTRGVLGFLGFCNTSKPSCPF